MPPPAGGSRSNAGWRAEYETARLVSGQPGRFDHARFTYGVQRPRLSLSDQCDQDCGGFGAVFAKNAIWLAASASKALKMHLTSPKPRTFVTAKFRCERAQLNADARGERRPGFRPRVAKLSSAGRLERVETLAFGTLGSPANVRNGWKADIARLGAGRWAITPARYPLKRLRDAFLRALQSINNGIRVRGSG